MTALIEIAGVTKRYRLGEVNVAALKGVDLTVRQGEFVALSGPSGSGKSTLLNICGLIDLHDEGDFRFGGEEVKEQEIDVLTCWRRERIGFVFQGFNLVPVMTAYENIEYPLLLNGTGDAERRTLVEAALLEVGLQRFAHHLPDNLSGGQRQRVAIARALIKRPLLVVADEPTANLDTESATQVIDLMHTLGQSLGTTFLIATHDERMTMRCERTVHLVDGVIHAQQPTRKLMAGKAAAATGVYL
ncbi:MAG TPA: ABC transporter ATP-binding protein [Gammaproteobacteria bacterium]